MKVIIPVLVGVLILGTLGLSQDAFALTSVSTCQTLNAPGETYELIADITTSGTCFTIDADNITFDGQDHTITGDNTGNGVQINFVSGATVQNLNVIDFSVGIFVSGSSHTITDNTATSNSAQGIRLASSTGSTISNNVLDSNGSGLFALNSNGNTATGNTADSNAAGIYFHTGSDNVVTGNTVENSISQGYWIHFQNNGLWSDNISRGNTFGMYMSQSTDTEVTDNVFDSNITGFFLDFVNSDNTISGNTIESSFSTGLTIQRSSNNNFIFNNNFVSNVVQISILPESASNTFSFPAPVGGNFWDTFDESGEGCDDVSPADGFCDSPLAFPNGQDDLPWTLQLAGGVPIPDTDGDGIQDHIDNCPLDANADQADANNNNVGDVCDPETLLITQLQDENAALQTSLTECENAKSALETSLAQCQADVGTLEATISTLQNTIIDLESEIQNLLNILISGEVEICHNDKTKTVSVASLGTHLDHGDAIGACVTP